jgi:hypothetical protein
MLSSNRQQLLYKFRVADILFYIVKKEMAITEVSYSSEICHRIKYKIKILEGKCYSGVLSSENEMYAIF